MPSLESIIYAFVLLGAGCDDTELSNLKLQKLLYYAQGTFLAKTRQPLFKEKIYAWPHGPVVKEAYQQLKSFGNQSITPDDYRACLDGRGDCASVLAEPMSEAIETHLQTIYDDYGPYTAWYLRNLTHSESPWRDTEHLQEITLDKMKAHFLRHG